jgi:uncharacterized protein YndB with AHSA1/START domain
MIQDKQAKVVKDIANKRLFIEREFDAPVALVWKAWTESNLLDQWWAPKPWKTRTKTMEFREGGFWLYCMEGPDGMQSWGRADYQSVIPQKKFVGIDSFCDENGNKNPDFPTMHWTVTFSGTAAGTKVEVEITFSSEADVEKILHMGFEAGFTAALENLDALLESNPVNKE